MCSGTGWQPIGLWLGSSPFRLPICKKSQNKENQSGKAKKASEATAAGRCLVLAVVLVLAEHFVRKNPYR
jgi:hypothetical protein